MEYPLFSIGSLIAPFINDTSPQERETLMKILPKSQRRIIATKWGEEVEEKFKGMGYFAYFQKGGLSLENLKEKIEEALSY